MLEIVDVPKEGRKVGYVAGAYKKGTWLVRSGTWTQAQIDALPTAQKNKAGYAAVGADRYQIGYLGGGECFPSDKIYFEPEDSDFDHDSYLAGQAVVGYTNGGTFRTTEFTDLNTSTTIFGTRLRLSASGTLINEADVDVQTENTVAMVEKLNRSNTKARDHRLEFTVVKAGLNT